MRRPFFEFLALLFYASSAALFFEGVRFLGRHDYAAATLLGIFGVAVIHLAAEMARLALLDRP